MANQYGEGIEKGARVEIHPACDLWMQGARFGIVRSVTERYARVKLDKYGKQVSFHKEDLRLA